MSELSYVSKSLIHLFEAYLCSNFFLFVVLLTSLLVTQATAADKIYKSVDPQGNVTYSSQPPADSVQVERVDVAPSPTDAQRRSAKERENRISAKANSMAEEREKRETAQREAERKAAQQQSLDDKQRKSYDERRRDNYYYGYPGLWYPGPKPWPGQPGRPGRPIGPDTPVIIPLPGGGGPGPGPGAGLGLGL